MRTFVEDSSSGTNLGAAREGRGGRAARASNGRRARAIALRRGAIVSGSILVGFAVASGCHVDPQPVKGGLACGALAESASAHPAASVAAIQAMLRANGRPLGASAYRVSGFADADDIAVQIRVTDAMNGCQGSPAPAGPAVDWNVTTNGPVRATPAVFSAWTSSSPSDLNAFASDTSSSGVYGLAGGTLGGSPDVTATASSSLFVLDQIHPTSGGPRLAYYDNVGTDHYGPSGLVFGADASNLRVYGLTTVGTLRCYLTPQNPTSPPLALNVCTGWGTTGFAGGHSVSWSSPFPIYDSSAGDVLRVYWTDDAGNLQCADTSSMTSGPTSCTGYPKSIGSYALGPPVVTRGPSETDLFFGDANGNFYQVKDASGTLSVNTACLATGVTGACVGSQAARWAVQGAPAIDYPNIHVYVAGGGTLQSFPLAFQTTASNWKPTATVTMALTSGSWSSPIASSPTIDTTGAFVYVAAGGSLYKTATPLTTSTASATALYKAPTTALSIDGRSVAAQSQPLGYVLPYYASVYTPVGTSSTTTATGSVEQYGCIGTTLAPGIQGTTLGHGGPYGAAIETGIVVDSVNGNLIFGYDDGTVTATPGAGGLVQYTASSTVPDTAQGWSCPYGPAATSNANCGETAAGCGDLGNLIAWYPLDNGSLADAMGGPSVTLSGPTFTTDKYGNAQGALSFNGSSYGTVSNAAFPVGSAARTMSVWFDAPTSSTSAGMDLADYGAFSASNRFSLTIDRDGTAEYLILNANDVDATTPFSFNTWHHFAATYAGGTNGAVQLWLDGVSIASTTKTLATTGTAMYLGVDLPAGQSCCPEWLTGSIDDLRLYGVGLTSAQIADLYAAGPQ